MKIQPINEQTFQGKHFISQETKKNLSNLLDKMNKESSYPNPNSLLDANIMVGLKSDNSIFIKGLGKDNTSLITLNNKTGFYIDNKTGEVKKFKKPFFSKWKTIIPKGEKIIEEFEKHFNEPRFVKKIFAKMPSLEEAKKMSKEIKELQNTLRKLKIGETHEYK